MLYWQNTILTLLSIVKIDQFQKKNKELANVAPGTYNSSLADKRSDPKWSMGGKLKVIDKRVSASPDRYDLPSKIIETTGKTMGQKLTGSLVKLNNVPGPGQYT